MGYGSDEASEVKALSDLSHSFEQSVEILHRERHCYVFRRHSVLTPLAAGTAARPVTEIVKRLYH
jgi:hypothetical protein